MSRCTSSNTLDVSCSLLAMAMSVICSMVRIQWLSLTVLLHTKQSKSNACVKAQISTAEPWCIESSMHGFSKIANSLLQRTTSASVQAVVSTPGLRAAINVRCLYNSASLSGVHAIKTSSARGPHRASNSHSRACK